MTVKLYSTGCPKCNVLKKKLAEKNVEFTLEEDMDKVIKFGEDNNKRSAPLLQVDDEVYEFVEANKWLSNL